MVNVLRVLSTHLGLSEPLGYLFIFAIIVAIIVAIIAKEGYGWEFWDTLIGVARIIIILGLIAMGVLFIYFLFN